MRRIGIRYELPFSGTGQQSVRAISAVFNALAPTRPPPHMAGLLPLQLRLNLRYCATGRRSCSAHITDVGGRTASCRSPGRQQRRRIRAIRFGTASLFCAPVRTRRQNSRLLSFTKMHTVASSSRAGPSCKP